MVAALEAMGSDETIRKALERVRQRAPGREIQSANDLIHALYEIGEDVSALRISCLIAELKEGESADAVAGLYAIAKLLPDDAWMAFRFAIECAQIRCGAHPWPEELFVDLDPYREEFYFSRAWKFWGARSQEAIQAARTGFRNALLHAAGLGDKPEYPESIAPPYAEPNGPILPGCPPELGVMICELLEKVKYEDELFAALRKIADAELGGAFAIADEKLWKNLSEDLKEVLAKAKIGVGARLSRLIEAVLARSYTRESVEALGEALLKWADSAHFALSKLSSSVDRC